MAEQAAEATTPTVDDLIEVFHAGVDGKRHISDSLQDSQIVDPTLEAFTAGMERRQYTLDHQTPLPDATDATIPIAEDVQSERQAPMDEQHSQSADAETDELLEIFKAGVDGRRYVPQSQETATIDADTATVSLDNLTAEQYTVDHDVFVAYPKTVHKGRQDKHIVGSNNYIVGRSIFAGNKQQAEALIQQYSGTGQQLGENKERVDFNKEIGYYVDGSSGKRYPTTIGIIHYSKSGAHIVPAKPNNCKLEDT